MVDLDNFRTKQERGYEDCDERLWRGCAKAIYEPCVWRNGTEIAYSNAKD